MGSAKIERTPDDQLVAALKIGAVNLGMSGSNLPNGYVISAIIESLRNFHSTITIKELKLAFDLAAAYKLDFDPKTYQNFSPLYVNELLLAYKKWSSATYKMLRPGSDMNAEANKPDWSYHIYRRLPAGVLRGEIQQGYENFLRGVLTDRRYIPYEWWGQLHDDGYIEYDDDATIFENKRVNQLDAEDKKKLGNGQQMVWLLFEMAKQRRIADIYVRG